MILTVFLLGVVVTRGLCFVGFGGFGGFGGGGYRVLSLPLLKKITVPPCCPESQSPSGGPSRNPMATVCYFNRSNLEVECINGMGLLIRRRSAKCAVVAPSQKNDSLPGGPTPYGEYLIGKRYTHLTKGIDWYKIFPRKDNSDYYGYREKNSHGRDTMAIHPGTKSEGCVTVKSNSCWKQIKSVIDRGFMRWGKYINWKSYRGILYVVP